MVTSATEMLLLYLAIACLSSCRALDITIGHIYSQFIDADATRTSGELAVQRIQNDINEQLNITIISRPSLCQRHLAAEIMYEFRAQHNVDAILGPICSSEMESVGVFAAGWDLPILGYVSRESTFTNKQIYSTLARVNFLTSEFAHSALTALEGFGWSRVGLFALDSWPCDVVRETLHSIPEGKHGVKLVDLIVRNMDELPERLEEAKSQVRILLVCFGTMSSSVPYMLAAHAANMTGPEYAHIIIHYEELFEPMPWQVGDKEDTELLKELFAQMLVLLPEGFYVDTVLRWAKRIESVTLPAYNKSLELFKHRSIHLSMIHDVLYLYGLAVEKCLLNQQNNISCNWKSGKDIFQLFRDQIFRGKTGRVLMSDRADRLSDFYLESRDENDRFVVRYKEHTTQTIFPNRTTLVSRKLQTMNYFNWRTEDNEPPRDTPTCGFQAELCPVAEKTYWVEIGLVFAAVILVTVIVIAAVFKHKQNQFESELIAKSWLIPSEDVILDDKTSFGLKSAVSMMSGTSTHYHESHCLHGRYKNREVEVHFFAMNKRAGIESAARDTLLMLREMRQLNHDNVNPFVGICLEPTKMKIIWNYCQKGELDDIVFNEEIELDDYFKMSIIRDIIKGLEYIHNSKVQCHGSLILRHCRVNSLWMVKLSIYGIFEVLRPYFLDQTLSWNVHITNMDMIQVAPEVLRSFDHKNGPTDPPTKEADMYSLGMLVYQILLRERPFYNRNSTTEEIIQHLKTPVNYVIRPDLPAHTTQKINPRLVTLLKTCWNEDPIARNNIARARSLVFSATDDSYSTGLVDHMIGMMEQYAKNLEKVVETRTKELVEERQRSDALLEKMLPKSISESLKRGVSVEPEFFDVITLMFADIVGFTSICSVSSPSQVVNMMNTFYSTFDQISERFDVYKVETIGDAYMVASGLPIRNGNKHVTEIANLALSYRESIKDCEVPHLPGRRLQVRIGIHTGSVAAGVVGQVMPHYCLFGDTVNMASRMESNGLPMKIQVSLPTKTFLEGFPEYQLTFRGEVDIKGKGQQACFWLDWKPGIRGKGMYQATL